MDSSTDNVWFCRSNVCMSWLNESYIKTPLSINIHNAGGKLFSANHIANNTEGTSTFKNSICQPF